MQTEHRSNRREIHKTKQKQLSDTQHITITAVANSYYPPCVRHCKKLPSNAPNSLMWILILSLFYISHANHK